MEDIINNDINNDINSYKEKGYIIKKNIISNEIINTIFDKLKDIKTQMNIPHTNIQFGYGNLIDNEIADFIINNEYIKRFCNKLYNNDYINDSVYVHNKHRWVGPDIEWHQEIFNIDTFYPTVKELSNKEILNNFMQVYIPLDNQNLENGCLKIIPECHKEGILKSYDTTNTHLNHKRAIVPEELDRIYKKYGILNLNLQAGDVVFFNHLIPHGSSSNCSPYDRKAVVLKTFKKFTDFNEEIRQKDKDYRKNFSLGYLENIINNRKNKDLYECGKKKI